jgi:hypothetical protein
MPEERVSENEARRTIYNIYFEYVNQMSGRPSIEEFFNQSIADSFDIPGQLDGWEEFLIDAVSVDIRRTFKRRGNWIRGFSGSWLRDNKKEKWEALIQHMRTNLFDIE